MTHKTCVNHALSSDDARVSDFGPTAPTKFDADNPRPTTTDASPAEGSAHGYIVTWETPAMAGDWEDGSYDVGH